MRKYSLQPVRNACDNKGHYISNGLWLTDGVEDGGVVGEGRMGDEPWRRAEQGKSCGPHSGKFLLLHLTNKGDSDEGQRKQDFCFRPRPFWHLWQLYWPIKKEITDMVQHIQYTYLSSFAMIGQIVIYLVPNLCQATHFFRGIWSSSKSMVCSDEGHLPGYLTQAKKKRKGCEIEISQLCAEDMCVYVCASLFTFGYSTSEL